MDRISKNIKGGTRLGYRNMQPAKITMNAEDAVIIENWSQKITKASGDLDK